MAITNQLLRSAVGVLSTFKKKINEFATSAQPTPVAYTATATLLMSDLLARIVTSTSAGAVALTLPSGDLVEAGLNRGAPDVNASFEWSVINLGSVAGAVTMTAGTNHTYVGNATVAIGTSAKFRTARTAAGVYVTYRVGG